MARINVVLPDDIEHKLRVAVAQEGGKKGDLSEAIEKAILEWIQRNDRRK
jgi:Arc/MetJ-type ribon-helix-helix transcriptional regulator